MPRQTNYPATVLVLALTCLFLFPSTILAEDLFVSPLGDDEARGTRNQPLRNIQTALSRASAGDRVLVRGGRYEERLVFPKSGNQEDGFIQLRGFGDEQVILDGERIPGENMILIEDQSYIRITGFEFANNLDVTDGSAIRIEGSGSHIQIMNNVIHDMRGKNAMAITVYGTSKETPISHVKIQRNKIYDCEPAPSEAIAINGNVMRFFVIENEVHDVNNIGIDVIGGELDIIDDPTLVARNGEIVRNTVYRARSNYEGGYGAGIYVDGGRNITIDSNRVYECDLGIEVGAENAGIECRNITVQNNLIYRNDKAGLVFGGYDETVGKVKDCQFINNTIYGNDTLKTGVGQIWIQYADTNQVVNNIIVAEAGQVLLYSEKGNQANSLNFNLWHSATPDDEPPWTWNGRALGSFSDYKTESNQGSFSLYADPQFQDADKLDFHLLVESPAIGKGTDQDQCFAKLDFDQVDRTSSKGITIGAYEYVETDEQE